MSEIKHYRKANDTGRTHQRHFLYEDDLVTEAFYGEDGEFIKYA